MKPAISLIVLSLCTVIIADNCKQKSNDCELTEYTEYVKCLQERTKRDINCRNEQYGENIASYEDICNCDNYNCRSCSTCMNSCDTCCSQCCNTISTCTTSHCCHNYCHTSCRDSYCRNSCKKSCREQIINNKNGNRGVINITTANHTNTIVKEANARHNITTIINLKNFINNTNLINIPIEVNYTNFNNINQDGNNLNSNPNRTCCSVIGPKQCVPQAKFPFIRCFHIRKKYCSPICLSPILHYHQYEICDTNNNESIHQPCQKQTIYIPQPKPRCAYHPVWPYVNCNGYNYQSCEGCYNHYINPFGLNQCSPFCYDDGFGVGPYYRQGPFYRPGFAHIPSCYQTGYCDMMGNYGGFGNFGGFGAPSSNFAGFNGGYYPNFGGFNNIPTWNLGYPPHTYNTLPFIVDNINDNDNNSNNQQYYNPAPLVWPNYRQDFDVLTNNPYPPPFVLSDQSPPKDVSIETEILTPRKTKYAEIKIQADDKEYEDISVKSPIIEVREIKEAEETTQLAEVEEVGEDNEEKDEKEQDAA